MKFRNHMLIGAALCSIMAETGAGEVSGAGGQEATQTEAPASNNKSIIDPKYRGKYKQPDWLGQLLLDNASTKKTIPAKPAVEAKAGKPAVGKEGEEGYQPPVAPVVGREATPERVVNDGVDVEALFQIGAANGLNLEKFRSQVGSHGFEGRFRMTVRNMLQTVVKQRHGLMVKNAFVSAPTDFLRKIGILEGQKPTHGQDGTKIVQPKAAAAPKEETSKLIKADAPAASEEANQSSGEAAAPKPKPKATAKKK